MADDSEEAEHPDSIPEDEADDDETAALRPLFPQGEDSPVTADEWRELLA